MTTKLTLLRQLHNSTRLKKILDNIDKLQVEAIKGNNKKNILNNQFKELEELFNIKIPRTITINEIIPFIYEKTKDN